MKRAACALLLVVGAAFSGQDSRLAAEEGVIVPVDVQAWESRDLEGRWALYRATPGREWIPFLKRRKEWQVLTWIALTTNNTDALDALREAKRPNWVAVGVWNLNTKDSHNLDSAEVQLNQHRPLVRSWFARHPEALFGGAADYAKGLTADGNLRDDAGAAALSPPVSTEGLVEALTPPAAVVPFGDRLRAEPGVRYVHQVQRALDLITKTGLAGEPWAGRVAALVVHPVADVRRAAALAAASRPRDDVPVQALVGRIDAPDEAPDVRSAAVLGLSVSPALEARWKLITVGLDPRHPSFTAAVSRLADVDDGFALAEWQTLDALPAGTTARLFLVAERARLAERLASHDGSRLAQRVPALLALAAYARVRAHPLQTRLHDWTADTLAAGRAHPHVRTALDAATATFDPADISPLDAGDMRLRDEVRAFAKEILARPEPVPAPR